MTDDDLARLAAVAGLNKMLRGAHFSICAVDDAARAMGVIPDPVAYRILQPLHCVDWADMPLPLRQGIPGLLQRCLTVTGWVFEFQPSAPPPPAGPGRGLLRLLGR